MEVILVVPGMGSDHCAGIIRDSLNRLGEIGEIKTHCRLRSIAPHDRSHRHDRQFSHGHRQLGAAQTHKDITGYLMIG